MYFNISSFCSRIKIYLCTKRKWKLEKGRQPPPLFLKKRYEQAKWKGKDGRICSAFKEFSFYFFPLFIVPLSLCKYPCLILRVVNVISNQETLTRNISEMYMQQKDLNLILCVIQERNSKVSNQEKRWYHLFQVKYIFSCHFSTGFLLF